MKNKNYAFKGRGEQEKWADVATAHFLLCSLSVYAYVDPGSTLSFVTPLLSSEFDLLPDIIHEPFLLSTPIADNIKD